MKKKLVSPLQCPARSPHEALRDYAEDVASLVWRKALANCTPEVRAMLLVWRTLREMPAEWGHEQVVEQVRRGEAILTDGFRPSES